MSFSCFTIGGSDLCFNGGVCNQSGNFETCSCPPGWVHDNIFWHQNNCALPEETYLVFLIEFSVLFILTSTVLLLRARQLERTPRKLLLLHIPTLIFHEMFAITLYLEQGMFEASCICFFLSLVWSAFQMQVTLEYSIFGPISIGKNLPADIIKRTLRLLRMLPAGNTLLLVILTILMTIFSRDSDPHLYNIFATCFMGVFPFGVIFHLFILRHLHMEFQRLLEAASLLSNRTSIKEFKEKAEKSMKDWSTLITQMSVGNIPLIIIYVSLGSFPYFWIYQVIFLNTIFPVSALIIKYFSKKQHGKVTNPASQNSRSVIQLMDETIKT